MRRKKYLKPDTISFFLFLTDLPYNDTHTLPLDRVWTGRAGKYESKTFHLEDSRNAEPGPRLYIVDKG